MTDQLQKKVLTWPFYLVAIAVFLLFCGPSLFTKTMFMDGLIYSVVARNMAIGIGSIWEPVFTESMFNPFYEHPPIAIWLQSVWFKILGDSWIVERIYSAAVTVLTGVVIVKIWNLAVGEKRYGWLPILFWGLVPTVTWAVCNNMLETTMTFFVCASACCYLVGFNHQNLFYSALAGMFCGLGVLSKGPVGLFIWSLPFFVFIVFRKQSWKRAIIDQSLVIGFTLIPIAVLMLVEEGALHSLSTYVDHQFSKSVVGVSSHGRLRILQKLVEESYVMLFLTAVIFGVSRLLKIKIASVKVEKSWALVFILVALAGILPILISLKQRTYYLHSAMPFLAIAIALICYPIVVQILQKLDYSSKAFKAFSGLAVLLLVVGCAITVAQFGSVGRDNKMQTDQRLIANHVGHEIALAICPDLRKIWSLHGYFHRASKISLHWTNTESYRWIVMRSECDAELGIVVEKVDIPTNEFHLYAIVDQSRNQAK